MLPGVCILVMFLFCPLMLIWDGVGWVRGKWGMRSLRREPDGWYIHNTTDQLGPYRTKEEAIAAYRY